jgi:hypothetical protein
MTIRIVKIDLIDKSVNNTMRSKVIKKINIAQLDEITGAIYPMFNL